MRLSCERDGLADALTTVSRAATARGPISVLTGVRLEAMVDRVVLAATDTELAIRVAAPAVVNEDGVGVAPARTFLELVRRLPDGQVDLVAEADQMICLRCADGEYRLNALSAADFPDIPTSGSAVSARIERTALVDAFSRVGRVAARDLSRPVYTGILFGVDQGSLTMVATDGYRLAVVRVDASGSGDVAPTLIPARAIAEIVRLPPRDDAVELTVSENLVVFDADAYRVTSRRLNGQFQSWEPLVNADFAHEVVVDRTRLLAAVERASVLVRRGTPVVLNFHDDALRVNLTSAEMGDASELIPLAASSAAITLAFNPTFLMEGLQILRGPSVRIRMNDGLRPVVMSDSTNELTYLVAPIRVNR